MTSKSEEDEDLDMLYGDLEATGVNEELKRVQGVCKKQLKKITELTDEVSECRDQVKRMAEDKQVMETNLIAVWNTASHEIARKDKMIAELNKKVASLSRR